MTSPTDTMIFLEDVYLESVQLIYNTLPSKEHVQLTKAAIEKRGISVDVVGTKDEALDKVKKSIPNAASVMTGGSMTLRQIGFTEFLKSGDHQWRNLMAEALSEKDNQKKLQLRQQSTLADYFIGSVNAISETGELVFASASGSQLPAYAYSSNNIIWVAGSHKITPTLDEAIKRVREYVQPLNDKRTKDAGFGESPIGKLLIFEGESRILRRKLNLILVEEVLGF